MRKFFLFFAMINICFADGISPDMQRQYDAYQAQAKSMTKQISSRADFQSFNIGNYTNDPSAINNPQQQKYYANPNAIKADSQREFVNNDTAKYTEKAYLNEPAIDDQSVTNTKLTKVIANSQVITNASPGFCTDGKCFVPDRSKTQGSTTDFAKPVTQLAAVAAAGKDVSSQGYTNPDEAKHKIRVEKGEIMSCKISRTFNHCTHPSSVEEKKLAKAKSKNEVIIVGKYCSSHVLNFCLGWTEKSCVFDSDFAKVVQKNGKPQIGLNFGTAKNPNCRGFTIEEFQRLNFDKMDFSELYSDVINSMNMPDKKDIIDKAKQRMRS